MTDPTTTPPPPPSFPPAGTGGPSTGTASNDASTTDTARDEARQTAQVAGDEAGNIANEARAQASNVASEAASQVRDLAEQVRAQAQEHAGAQQQMVASQMRSFCDELSSMASNSEQPGTATEVVRQTSQRIREAASWLESSDPADVLEAVRDVARRRPGAFLAGAAVAGLAVGRLTRAGVDSHRETSADSLPPESASQPLESALAGTPGYHAATAPPVPSQVPPPVAPPGSAVPAADSTPGTGDPLEPALDPNSSPSDPSDPLTRFDGRGLR